MAPKEDDRKTGTIDHSEKGKVIGTFDNVPKPSNITDTSAPPSTKPARDNQTNDKSNNK